MQAKGLAEMSDESLLNILTNCTPTASVLSFSSWKNHNTKEGDLRLSTLSATPNRSKLSEAVQLVNSDSIRLEDHTVAVEPLEHYEKAWDSIRSGKQFNVLLSVSRELEDL